MAKMRIFLKPIEWGIFANEFALMCSYAMIIGGIVGVVYKFAKWEIGIFSLIAGSIVFFLEYPRSYRDDSKFVERRFQHYLVPYLVAIGYFARNFYVRTVAYLFFSIPCFFLLPTFIGATCMVTASLIYLIAAKQGFEWISTPPKSTTSAIDSSLSLDNFVNSKETVC